MESLNSDVFVVTGADRVDESDSDCHDWSFADAVVAPPALHEVESLNTDVFAYRRVGCGAVKVFQKEVLAKVVVGHC
jgi:hypothetical protein